MRVVENVTIYKCDFCKKELKRKHAMQNHENRCNNNPINNRPCLNGCKHLEKRDINWDVGKHDYVSGEPVYHNGKAFYCALHKKFILHPKVENEIGLKWVWNSEDKEVEQEPMPKECKEFDDNIFNF